MTAELMVHAADAIQATGAAADTIYVATAPATPVAIAADVAVVLLALSFLVLTYALVRALREIDRATRSLRKASGDVGTMVAPVLERSRSIAENADHVVASVRKDVERLEESVGGVADRIDATADRVEARAREFDALLDVVQDEAETLFVDTASTVRGLRAGARRLSRDRRRGDGGDGSGRRRDEPRGDGPDGEG